MKKREFLGPEVKKRKRTSSSKEEIEKAMRELFNEKPTWKDYSQIKRGLEKKGIRVISQSSISRYLNEKLKATKSKETGLWSLDKITAYDQKLAELRKLFLDTRDNPPRFTPRVQVATLNVKNVYSNIIAKTIENTFVDEVVCVSCPNDRDIVIYYNITGDDATDKLEKTLFGLCAEVAADKNE
jgi:arginine repressor